MRCSIIDPSSEGDTGGAPEAHPARNGCEAAGSCDFFSILHLEDDTNDAELIREALSREGIVCRLSQVWNREDYLAALELRDFDLILADHSLPSFDGATALELAQERCPEVPFIFLSGTMNGQRAAESILQGAADHVSKSELSRLAPSIRRAIEVIRERGERRRAEVDLDRFFCLSADLLCVAGFDGSLKRLNPAWERALGFPISCLRATPLLDLVHPDDRGRTRSHLEQLAASGEPAIFESRFCRHDGNHVWLQWNAMPLLDEKLIYVSARDVTERKHAEEALRRSEARTRGVIESSLDCVVAMNQDGDIVEFNPAAEKTFGYCRSEVMGRRLTDLIVLPMQGAGRSEDYFRNWDNGRGGLVGKRVEAQATRRDGSIFPIELAVSRIDIGEGVLFTACMRDITDRRRAESEIEKLAAFPRFNPQAVMEISGEGSVSYYNEAALALAKSLGQNRPTAILPSDTAAIAKGCLALGQTRLHHETTSGDRTLSWSFFPIPVAGIVHCYASDVTERKRAEEQIIEQAALLDKAQDAIVVRDLEHRILFWNRGASRVYGWSAEEAVGRSAIELFSRNSGAQFLDALQAVLSKNEWSGELRHSTKAGGEVVVESRWTLVRDSEGHPKSILTLSTDVTEKRKLEGQFLRAQRLESIGTLASGIAHDLNNILAPIMMSVNLLQETQADDRNARLLETLRTGVQRGAEMVKQILSFTRGQEGGRVLISLKHLVSEVSKIMQETFPKSISIKSAVAKDLWTTVADATQIHQVLMNLCVNARDAMPNGGSLCVAAVNLTVDADSTERPPEALPGPYVVLSVADTGTGIPPEVMEKIWEPFFTLKPEGIGTGLGLSTVQTIVKNHGGWVRAESEPGKGTRFRVFLPASAASEKAAEPDKPASLPVGHGEKILVIDDERAFQEITKAIFTKFGYRVLTASDGTEAVALFAQHKDDIDLVLTDMVMPFLDGPATINALRRLDPTIRIIASSGMSENEKQAEELTGAEFLLKPFTTEKLLNAVERSLKSRRTVSP